MALDKIEKVNRSQFVTFLDTKPGGEEPTWSILGIGITDYGIAYNPQVDTEKWIIEDNARNDHTSNQKQGSVSQKIDRWNGTEESYPAKMSDCLITVTQFMNEDAVIEYDLYYNGEPVEGKVTFAAGVPKFTPNVEI